MKNLRPYLYLAFIFCLLNIQLGNFGFGGTGIRLSDFVSSNVVYGDVSSVTASSIPASASQQMSLQSSIQSSLQTAQTSSLQSSQQTSQQSSAQSSQGKPDVVSGVKSKPGGKAFVLTEQYLSLLMMIAIAIVTQSIMSACVGSNPDVVIAAIGGLTYIASEIVAIVRYSKLRFKTIDYRTNEQGYHTDFQLQAINDQIDLFEEAIKTAEIKRGLQIAAASTFAVATAVATARYVTNKITFFSCFDTVALSLGPLGSACPSKCNLAAAACAAICGKCAGGVGVAIGSLGLLMSKYLAPESSRPKDAWMKAQTKQIIATLVGACADISLPYVSPAIAACTYYSTDLEMSTHVCDQAALQGAIGEWKPILKDYFQKASIHYDNNTWKKVTKTIDDPKDIDNIIQLIGNNIIPTAQADQLTSGLGLAAVAIAVLIGYKATQANQIDLFIATPFTRLFLWGAFMAIATTTSVLTSEIISEFEDYVKDLKKIRSKMLVRPYGVASSAGPLAKHLAPDRPRGATEIDTSRSQIQQGDQDLPFGETGGKPNELPCIAKSKNNKDKCGSISNLLKSSKAFLKKDSILNQAIKDVAKAGEALQGSGKIKSETLDHLNKIGEKKAFYQKHGDKLKDMVNKLNKKNKGKEIDFAKNQNDLLERMRAATIKEFEKQGEEGTLALIAGLTGGAYIPSKVVQKKTTAATKTKDFFPLIKQPTFKFKGHDIDFNKVGLGAKKVIEKAKDLGLMKPSAKELKYDPNVKDIVEEGPSLWEVVSNRYLRSAWKKLGFKKKRKQDRIR